MLARSCALGEFVPVSVKLHGSWVNGGSAPVYTMSRSTKAGELHRCNLPSLKK
jgi:hypothetical protein